MQKKSLRFAKALMLAGAFMAGTSATIAFAQNAPSDLLLPNSDAEIDPSAEPLDQTDSEPRIIFADSNQDPSGPIVVENSDLTSDQNQDQAIGGGIQQDPFRQNQIDPTNRSLSDGTNSRATRADQVGIIGPDGGVTPLANSRAIAEQSGNGAREDNPYAPLGIRVGTFTFLPVLTQTLGYTSNADFADNGASSAFSQTDLRLTAISDWSLHQLRGEIGGSYQTFFNGTSDDLPSFDANMQLRLDHTRDLTTTFGANYALTTESPESDNLTVPFPLFVTDRPNVHRYGGFAEVTNQWGRWNTSLRGTVTHSVFEKASLSDGSALPQGDRTNTLYEARARLGYETSAAFQPFVEATIGSRNYVRRFDRNGNRRDRVNYALRGGLNFNQGEKLNGEIALGYSSQHYVDDAIDDLNGVTIDANINWSPQRFTTVTATAQTAFTGSINANDPGSVTYATSLGIVHDVRLNLSLNARVLASIQTFDGSNRQDNTLQVSTGAEWRLNRTAAIVGSVGYEVVDSNAVGSSYEAVTGRLGFRLQR